MSGPDERGGGLWVKGFRSADALELIKRNHRAYVLASVIAMRANYLPGFNSKGLEYGEAMLGDHSAYGMTRQEYRSALRLLEDAGFATTRPTNKGTIAKLCDRRLFELPEFDQQPPSQPSGNHQGTTNKTRETRVEGKRPHSATSRISAEKRLAVLRRKEQDLEQETAERWQREAHPERLTQLREVRDQIANLEEGLQ